MDTDVRPESDRSKPQPLKKRVFWVLFWIGAAVVLAVAATVVSSWRRPVLGLRADGRLSPCPPKPNCVCSQDAAPEQKVDPMPWQGHAGDPILRLRGVLAGMRGATVVTQEGPYLRAEFVTPLWRFVDDAEFLWVPAEGVIHVRLASRVGHSDLGVNRARLEEVRRRFLSAPP
jgi:uncharacterized protein (DUF1499 family)